MVGSKCRKLRHCFITPCWAYWEDALGVKAQCRQPQGLGLVLAFTPWFWQSSWGQGDSHQVQGPSTVSWGLAQMPFKQQGECMPWGVWITALLSLVRLSKTPAPAWFLLWKTKLSIQKLPVIPRHLKLKMRTYQHRRGRGLLFSRHQCCPDACAAPQPAPSRVVASPQLSAW